jgi:hypothetical protein
MNFVKLKSRLNSSFKGVKVFKEEATRDFIDIGREIKGKSI